MAWGTPTARGSATEEVSDTSISMNPSANLTVNLLAFVCCVTDNYVTTKGASSQHTVTDAKSNLWRKISEYTESDGVAADGVTISIHGARITTQINTTDTITLTC